MKTRILPNEGKFCRQSGQVLLVVVLLSSIAAILAAALYYASSSHVSSARRHIRIEKAFFIAEAGIERAKAELKQASGSFNDILLGADGAAGTSDDGVLSFGASVDFGGGTYSVRVTDNVDSDPSLFFDTDKTVVIWSTGVYQNVRRVLEVCVSLSDAINPPLSADGAVILYGLTNTVTLKGSALIDGQDYALPANFNCSGAGCLGSVIATNPATAGVFSTDTNSVVSNAAPSLILGDPPISLGTNAPSLTRDYWTNMVEQLLAIATINITGGVIGGNTTIGTRTNPQVAVLTGDTKITGNVDGAGILLVTADVEIDTTGTFHYEGIVIFIGDNNKFNDKGTASIFGAVISLGANLYMKPQGSPQIMYSTEALANLKNLQLPPAELSLVYWREVK